MSRMVRHKITPEKLDFISDYLANSAERMLLPPELIEQYKEAHKNRAKTGRRWRVTRSLLKHKNAPYCNVCDNDLEPWDDVYLFHVRALLIYHVDCFTKTRPSKKLSIIYQDRAYRHPKVIEPTQIYVNTRTKEEQEAWEKFWREDAALEARKARERK